MQTANSSSLPNTVAVSGQTCRIRCSSTNNASDAAYELPEPERTSTLSVCDIQAVITTMAEQEKSLKNNKDLNKSPSCCAAELLQKTQPTGNSSAKMQQKLYETRITQQKSTSPPITVTAQRKQDLQILAQQQNNEQVVLETCTRNGDEVAL